MYLAVKLRKLYQKCLRNYCGIEISYIHFYLLSVFLIVLSPMQDALNNILLALYFVGINYVVYTILSHVSFPQFEVLLFIQADAGVSGGFILLLLLFNNK